MILAATRARGYGTRDASFVGGYYGGPPIADGLLAIAVPLRDGPRVLGALNMLWMRPAHTVEAFANRFLPDVCTENPPTPGRSDDEDRQGSRVI